MKALIRQKAWRHFTSVMPLLTHVSIADIKLTDAHNVNGRHETFYHGRRFGTQPTIIDELPAALNRASKRDMMFWMFAGLGGFPLPQKRKNDKTFKKKCEQNVRVCGENCAKGNRLCRN